MHQMWRALLLCLLLPALFAVNAQDIGDLMDMNLEDILNMDITVFSVRGLTQRETPGVMTIIPREEIVRSGARDLTDVLRLVPGFELGVDIQNAVSLGIRGIWAQEGKVLLMVDGMEMNEILYSCLALGDHYPVDQIQRIEIIRGPGTSFYGANAELAVINLITKSAIQLNGLEAGVRAGRSAEGADRQSLSINFGDRFGKTKFKAMCYAGESIRSDRDYKDIYGNRYCMLDDSKISPIYLLTGLEYGKFKVDFVTDRYRYKQRDALDEIIPVNVDVYFNQLTARLRYETEIWNGFTFTPSVFYLRQEPWKSADRISKEIDFFYFNIAERIKPSFVLKGSVTDNLQLVTGGELVWDRARVSDDTPEDQYFSDGKKRIENSRLAVYAQAFYTGGSLVPSLGLRYDLDDASDQAVLPWIGVSQTLGYWTLKAMFGQNFRAPSLENININHDLDAEKTTTAELELGFQPDEHWIFILDYFRTHVKGPIVYYYDPETDEELYGNYGSIGTQGIEFETRARWNAGYMNLSYSFYRPIESIDFYSAGTHSDMFLGFPAHKITFIAGLPVAHDISLTPSLVWVSCMYGYDSVDVGGNNVLSRFKPAFLANVYLHHSRIFSTGLEAGLGVYNLFDVNNPIIQPYNSGHAPIPILSREFVLYVRYSWKF